MILFLSTADTELLAARAVCESLPPGMPPVRAANPARLPAAPSLEGVEAVVVRLLGGRRAWERPFGVLAASCRARGVPLLAYGGEALPDEELAAASTVPAPVLAAGFAYLVEGGLANLEQFFRFVADEVLGLSVGHEPPRPVPEVGILGDASTAEDRPTVAVVFYRAHLLAGNTGFVEDLATAIEERGANALCVYCYSLRAPHGEAVAELLGRHRVDAVVTTVLAGGSALGDPDGFDGWEAPALCALDVPVVQAVASTSSTAAWAASSSGLSPLDVAMGVAIPELDGRVITVPTSFKEVVDDFEGLGDRDSDLGPGATAVTAYRSLPDRVARVAGLAVRLARLRRTPPNERKVAIVLSAYPTKRSRLGNAVGLDTPASVVALLRALKDAGYRVDRLFEDGDALMAELASGLPYEEPVVPAEVAARALGRLDAEGYERLLEELPAENKAALAEAWGPPPGQVYRDGDELVFGGIDLGGVLVCVQPPRGFSENPVALYHSPDLVPTHHYVAFYRFLERRFGAHAIVHVGKHGTLEWLPGKAVGLSGGCWPDATLGDLPLVYPFVVNDPGEGVQAKRRAHAVIVDHLVPPLTRADTYGPLARLEDLLDSYAKHAALDPEKLPALRRRIWDLLVEAELHRDLGVLSPPGFEGPGFDELVAHLDSYLCELKDAQIRGGLHVLGQAPEGEAELDLVAALVRLPQGSVPSLRATVAAELGVRLDEEGVLGRRRGVDEVDAECRRRLRALQASGWSVAEAEATGDPTLLWVCRRLVPALRATSGEIAAVLAALDGRHVPAGPAGAPSRGMANVLPTGRNFYSLDPRAVPSALAWEVGRGLAEALLARHHAEEGRYPETVGVVVWGTSAMRTGGDDVAMVLALLGVRPRHAEESGRVVGLEPIPLEELGRPRVDVTVRISGLFRDALPHVVELLDDAVGLVAALEEPAHMNFVRKHGAEDPRVFGPKPGAYGSGILALLESRAWRDDADLAEVYLTWTGFAYGRGGPRPAPEAVRRRLASVEVAVKNQDNREHDIFDSDDYLQDHGGMVAAIRAITGRQPKAFFGDSADPSRPRVRSLAEEAVRVARTRVLNPKWIEAMVQHGYKGAFELAATVDYLFGYDATARVVEDWVYERVTEAYLADPAVRELFARSNPWAMRSIAERLLEAAQRGLWRASEQALATIKAAMLAAEGLEEERS